MSTEGKGYDRSKMPTDVSVITTYRCQMRCKMCDIWTVYRKDREKLRQELTRDDFTASARIRHRLRDITEMRQKMEL